MTYIEWRDELAVYLTGISDGERKKIFDYYAEMYADKRDAGLEEKQIIAEFGAPYDVARRILDDMPKPQGDSGTAEQASSGPAAPPYAPSAQPAAKTGSKVGHYIKILLLIAAIAALIMLQVAVVCTAASYIIDGSLYLVYGEIGNSLSLLGLGLVFAGIAVIIIALFVGVERKIINSVKAMLHGGESV